MPTTARDNIDSVSVQIQKIIDKYTVEPGNENQLDMIVDSVWLGNEHAIANHNLLNEKMITDVINISDSDIKPPRNINYYNYLMIDKWACNRAYDSLIEECASMINYLVQNNRKVIIYCKRGHHRSASVVAYYLHTYLNYQLPDAIVAIKLVRPTALRRMSCMVKTVIAMCS